MKFTWMGHASFRIELAEAVLLVDPWLTGNPSFPPEARDAATQGVTHILLTHAHGDHLGDAEAISRATGAPIVTMNELANYLAAQGLTTIGFNKGGTVDLAGVKVTMVAASHSSSIALPDGTMLPAGAEVGYMLEAEGRVTYISGDTDIMADMAWMGEYHAPQIGILACGGHYTMDMKRAAWAANKYFNFKYVIPVHWGTFPLLAQSTDALRAGLRVGTQVIEPKVMERVTL